METIYTLNELLRKVEDEMARCEEMLKYAIRSETFFRRFTKTIAGLQSKLETLEETKRWIKAELKRQSIFNEIY